MFGFTQPVRRRRRGRRVETLRTYVMGPDGDWIPEEVVAFGDADRRQEVRRVLARILREAATTLEQECLDDQVGVPGC